MTLTSYPWRPSFDTQALCGDPIKAGSQAFKLSLSLCQKHAARLPQKALQEAILAEYAQPKQPSLLYRLWHWCFGKRSKPTPPAKQPPFAPKEPVMMCACAKHSTWPLTVLLACMQVLQQTAPQSCKPSQRRKNVYTYRPAMN